MPGGNSTSRPYNRSEKQASSRRKQRVELGREMLREATKGNIDRKVAERNMKALFKTEGHKSDTETVLNVVNKEQDRKLGKKYMQTPDAYAKKRIMGKADKKAFNKGGYCGASNPASRPMKKGK
jgi:hypothetical protein